MNRALVIIDIQNDYFDGGALPLPGSQAAAKRASEVLAGFRLRKEPILHVKHVWDAPDAFFMRPDTPGVDIHESVRPLQDEPIVEKTTPNALLENSLVEQLDAWDARELVVMGMMTSMCIDSSVRAASDAGYTVSLVHDACAAPDLSFGETSVPGHAVHAAFIAALSDGFAEIRSSNDFAELKP